MDCKIVLYIDDATLMFVDKDSYILESNLAIYLTNTYKWLVKIELHLNIGTRKFMQLEIIVELN